MKQETERTLTKEEVGNNIDKCLATMIKNNRDKTQVTNFRNEN